MSLTFDALRENLYPTPDPLLADPARWVAERTREHLWSKQIEILEAVRDHRKVAVKACHGPGKSWSAARCVGWWLDTHPKFTAFAVTTAPTDPQVKAILWREITRAHRRGALPGRVTLDAQWKIDDELVAMGRKPADHDENGFQGIHERYVLVVIDEACGVPKSLWTATDTLVTNEDARILAIGNPDDPLSEFATVCDGAPDDGTSGMSKEGWWVITISLFDTPNFTDEPVPAELRPYLPSQVWLEERRLKWGEGSPLWTSKVEGRFPADAADGTIPWSWLKKCQPDPTDEETEPIEVGRPEVALGVDVAGSELGDETVVRERMGMRAGRRWTVQSNDPDVVAQLVADAITESGATRVKYDAIGVGWGLPAGVRPKLGRASTVEFVPVTVSEQAPGRDTDGKPNAEKYANLRAFIWWEVGRTYAHDRLWDLTAVDDDTLNELSAPRYVEKLGRIQIESKDDLRKRIGRSTDNADALLLAYFEPPSRKASRSRQDRRGVLLGTR